MITIEESEIIKNWSKSTKPLVSINCLTYNHENFIATTINSFLIQKVSFPFEIIIGEDCSTDNTLKIANQYQAKYPNIIRVLSNEKNLGAYQNGVNVLKASLGKYIALCEGDDYWTDPLKLQKQVDFLEQNTEYVMTYTSAHTFSDNGIIHGKSGGSEKDLSEEELMKTAAINTLTVCFRNLIQDFPIEFFHAKFGDLFLWSLLGKYGKGKYLSNIEPSMYRIHEGGIFSKKTKKQQYEMALITDVALFTYYSRINNDVMAKYFKYRIIDYWITSESLKKLLVYILSLKYEKIKNKLRKKLNKLIFWNKS